MQIPRPAIVLLAFIVALCVANSNAIVIQQEDNTTQHSSLCKKANTEFKTCQSSTQLSCKNRNPKVYLADCRNGCFCKDGYLLNDNGDCILPEACPAITNCPANSTYQECASVCRKTCETQYIQLAYACMCQPGCECDEGFIPDKNGKNGKCILTRDCDPNIVKCPADKVYSQCQVKDRTCDNKDSMDPLGKQCQPGCFCKSGKVLDKDGKCVTPESCPKLHPVCPTNQTYSDCSLKGCGHSCSTYYLNIAFKCRCDPGCGCNQGFIRNAKQDCIDPIDCTEEETRCQDNQHFCDSEVRKTCKNPQGDGVLTSGCFCDEGFVYDEERKVCVDPGECQNSKENFECEKVDPNTEFKTCQPAFIDRCDKSGVLSTAACQRGCYCKPGTMLNNNGKCVTDCNDGCPVNSTYSTCAYNCGNNCRQMLLNIKCNLPCVSGCTCNEGFVWNGLNQCMRQTECDPKEIECPPRQQFYSCNKNIVITCQDKRISKVRDIESISCNWGCFCEDPYILDKDSGNCVQPEECSNSQQNQDCERVDLNSEFKTCQSSTRATCKNPNPTATLDDCNRGCFCKSGYYYNEVTKKCVTFGECAASTTSCPPNSTYSTCASACPQTCSTAYSPSAMMCMACYEGCECQSGYIRNSDKDCVLAKDCPEKDIICPYGRVYKSCEHGIKTCDNPTNNTVTECLRGCFCGNDMVENEEGRCVFMNECSKSPENQDCVKVDPNSHYQECQRVRNTCSDPQGLERSPTCMKGCFCNDGYVLDQNQDICVTVPSCTVN